MSQEALAERAGPRDRVGRQNSLLHAVHVRPERKQSARCARRQDRGHIRQCVVMHRHVLAEQQAGAFR
jgi:hypothetical protein